MTPDVPCDCNTTATAVGILIADSFLCVLSTSTVLVNLAFILTVALNRPLHTYTNKLLLSNAVVDLLVGLVVMPFHILKSLQGNCWQYGSFWCKFSQSLDIHLTTISIYHLIGVAAERYFRIVRVFWYERWIKRLIPWVIISFWILPSPTTFGGVFSDLHLEGAFTRVVNWTRSDGNTSSQLRNVCGKENPNSRQCQCSYWASQDFTTGTTFFQFFLPIVVMLYFYSRIFCVAYQHAKKIEDIRVSVAMSSSLSLNRMEGDSMSEDSPQSPAPSTGGATTRRGSRHALLFSKDIRVVRLCALVFLVFIVCWTPYFIMMMLEAYCVGNNYRSDADIFAPTDEVKHQQFSLSLGFYATVWLGFVNSLLNPVLLFCMEKNYRNGFRRMMNRRFVWLARLLNISNPRNRPYSMQTIRESTSSVAIPDLVDRRGRWTHQLSQPVGQT